MQLEQKQQFESETSGLWPRFITKLIAGWFFTYYLVLFLLTFTGLILFHNYIMPIIIAPLLILATWIVWKEIPLNWDNVITIYYKEKIITIASKNSLLDQNTVLDFDGLKIKFSEIDYYSIKNYESFIFSSIHLVSFFIEGKRVKCLSFKSAKEFTEFISVLNNQLGLKLK